MAIMYRFLLLTFSVYQVISERENIAINTERDFLAATDLEAGKRGPIHDTDIPLMFIRAASSKSKWGGGDYSLKKQKLILTAHNDFRRGVSPSSSDMNELVWSSKLAKQAQAWSDGCVYEHPDKTLHTDYEGIGQNLYIKYNDAGGNNPPSPASDPVTQWHGEVRDFSYGSNECNEGAVCGHYTQVVWSTTTKVGCGITFCSKAPSPSKTYKNAWLVTCNYSPAGNWKGEKPYKSGTKCTECEKGFCMNNLCSKCKSSDEGCECNIKCKNCGTKVAKTCSCNCPDGYYGSNCANRCQDTDDYCGARPGWPSSWCNNSDYPFVDEKCPKMCGICRAGPRHPQC